MLDLTTLPGPFHPLPEQHARAPDVKPAERLKRWASRLKTEVSALYIAYKDPRVPWYARALAAVVVGYALT